MLHPGQLHSGVDTAMRAKIIRRQFLSNTNVVKRPENLERIFSSAERVGVKLNTDQAKRWLQAIEAPTAEDDVMMTDSCAEEFSQQLVGIGLSSPQIARFYKVAKLVEIKAESDDIETALALCGSVVQRKGAPFSGDCDYFERINISAESWSEACAKLATLIRKKVLATMQGDTFQFVEAKFGEYPFDCRRGSERQSKGGTITWSKIDMREGYIVVYDASDSPTLLYWHNVQETPGWCKLDWIIVDAERQQLAHASNMLDATWQAPDGSITPLDGYLDAYFQEVYLNAEAIPLFTKLMAHVSADKLNHYVEQVEQQVKQYTCDQSEKLNYGRASKQLYNLFRLTGRYHEAAFLRELFDEAAALLYQVYALLKKVDQAFLSNGAGCMLELLNQCDELILAVIRTLQGAKEVEIVRHLLKLGHAICNHERGDAMHQLVRAASCEVANIVNNFFYERMCALPTIKDYLIELHSAEI